MEHTEESRGWHTHPISRLLRNYRLPPPHVLCREAGFQEACEPCGETSIRGLARVERLSPQCARSREGTCQSVCTFEQPRRLGRYFSLPICDYNSSPKGTTGYLFYLLYGHKLSLRLNTSSSSTLYTCDAIAQANTALQIARERLCPRLPKMAIIAAPRTSVSPQVP